MGEYPFRSPRGVKPHPGDTFMMQVAHNLTDCCDGFLLGKRFLILDRDMKYCEGFRNLLEDAGIDIVRLPVRAPNLNTYAERIILSIKTECLETTKSCDLHLKKQIRA